MRCKLKIANPASIANATKTDFRTIGAILPLRKKFSGGRIAIAANGQFLYAIPAIVNYTQHVCDCIDLFSG
jgi:hypothetical protein